MNSGIPEEIFTAAIVETDLNSLAGTRRVAKRKVGKPVMNIHPVAASCAATAITFTACYFTTCCSA
jgi:hypothetical protein